jgi:ankyrin repeat protein
VHKNLIVFNYGNNSVIKLKSGCGLLKLAGFDQERDREQLVEELGFNGLIQVRDEFYSVINGNIEKIPLTVSLKNDLSQKVFYNQEEYDNVEDAAHNIHPKKYTISNHYQYHNIKCLFDPKRKPNSEGSDDASQKLKEKLKALAQQLNILYQVDDAGAATPVTSFADLGSHQVLANLLFDKIFVPPQEETSVKEKSERVPAISNNYSMFLATAINKFCQEKTLLEQRDKSGDTVLHAAILAQNLKAIRQLADNNQLTQAVLLKKNYSGQTAVELAQNVKQKMIEELIKNLKITEQQELKVQQIEQEGPENQKKTIQQEPEILTLKQIKRRLELIKSDRQDLSKEELRLTEDRTLTPAALEEGLKPIEEKLWKLENTELALLKAIGNELSENSYRVREIYKILYKLNNHFKYEIESEPYTETPMEINIAKIHKELSKKVDHLRNNGQETGARAIERLAQKLESHLCNYQNAECYRKQDKSFDRDGFIETCRKELAELQNNTSAMKEINSPRGFSIQLLLAKIAEAFSSLFSNKPAENKNAFFTSTGKLLTNLDEELIPPAVPRGQS